MYNTKGDAAMMSINREKNSFHDPLLYPTEISSSPFLTSVCS